MKRKNLLLFSLAAVLVLTTFISTAYAYFTATASALGGQTVSLDDGWRIDEDFYDWTKHVVIESTGSTDCYVRARTYAPAQYQDKLLYSGDGWERRDDGWWYYTGILEGGKKTNELTVRIEGLTEAPELNENFDVVVVYECAPVLYDANGDPYTSWPETNHDPQAPATEGGNG